MQPVRASIFDLDGTLVDSRQAVVAAVVRGVAETAAAHGHEFTPAGSAVVTALGLPAEEYFRRLLPPELQHLAGEALERSTRHEVAALRAGEGELFAGVLEGLAQLRRAGWRIGIISNAQRDYFRAALETLGLATHCDHAMCHAELPEAGTASANWSSKDRLLALALQQLGAAAASSWMMGDRAEDLQAGRRFGCSTAAACYGFGQADEHLGANLLCASFAHFTKALRASDRSSP